MSGTCPICNKPITLTPSAGERSRQTGNMAEYYTRLFTTHSNCFIEKRKQDTLNFLRNRSPVERAKAPSSS